MFPRPDIGSDGIHPRPGQIFIWWHLNPLDGHQLVFDLVRWHVLDPKVCQNGGLGGCDGFDHKTPDLGRKCELPVDANRRIMAALCYRRGDLLLVENGRIFEAGTILNHCCRLQMGEFLRGFRGKVLGDGPGF